MVWCRPRIVLSGSRHAREFRGEAVHLRLHRYQCLFEFLTRCERQQSALREKGIAP
jgi:hypothetical protein